MITRLRITVCLAVLLSLSSGHIVAQVPGGVQKRYVSSIHGWSVSYPEGWQLDSSDPDQVMIKTASALPGGLVSIHALPPAWVRGSLEDIADNVLREWGQALQASGQTYRTISRRRVTLANEVSAFEIINAIGVGVVGRSRKVIFARGDRAFLIDAEAAESSWGTLGPQFDQIVNSFTMQ
jgi:hypothetical protein